MNIANSLLQSAAGRTLLDLTQQNPTLTTYGMVADVRDWGAVGNGTTDSTTAIQDALNACAGLKPVWIPAASGNYVISKALSLPSGTVLFIDGYLYLANGSNDTMLLIPQNASNVVIVLRGTLDGNKANNSTFGPNGNYGIATPFNNAGGQNVTNVAVFGCGIGTIKNCYNAGIGLHGVTNGLIEGLACVDCGNANGFDSGSTRCYIVRCTATGTADEGFALYGGVTYSSISDCQSYGNTAGSGIAIYNDSSQPAPCHDIEINNCMCWSNYSAGIEVASGSGAGGNHYNIQINNPHCFSNVTGGGGTVGGISITAGNVVTVNGGQSYKNGNGPNLCPGVCVSGGSTYVSILGTKCWDNGQGGTSGYGIYADNTCNYLVIQGTQTWDDQSTKTQEYGIGGLGGANVVVKDNWLGPALGSPGIGNLNTLGSGTIIMDNFGPNGYNPVGAFPSPPVPAANTNYVNAFGYPCQVSVSGGTGVSVSVNGSSTSQASGMFIVGPWESINLGNYTAAPTWAWTGL